MHGLSRIYKNTPQDYVLVKKKKEENDLIEIQLIKWTDDWKKHCNAMSFFTVFLLTNN